MRVRLSIGNNTQTHIICMIVKRLRVLSQPAMDERSTIHQLENQQTLVSHGVVVYNSCMCEHQFMHSYMYTFVVCSVEETYMTN